MTEQQKLTVFNDTDWGTIAQKLTAFVITYFNYFGKRKYCEWNLPKGYQAQDIAHQAIADVLGGKRNWDPDEQPDLLHYLQFSVCRSIISNLLSSAENRTIVIGLFTDLNTDDEEDPNNNSNVVGVTEHTEESIDHKIYLKGLGNALLHDKTSNIVLLLMFEGYKTKEIAAALEISTEQVSNSKKRIKRKYTEMRVVWDSEPNLDMNQYRKIK